MFSWTQPNLYSFGTYQEEVNVFIPLPVSNATSATFTVLSGQLPPGLSLIGTTIQGTAINVPRNTTYTFCIRGVDSGAVSDHTFSITIDGPDQPTFLTPAGPLPIGSNGQSYISSGNTIEFQIEAIDQDLAVGQRLRFYKSGGSLPTGVILNDSGLLFGTVDINSLFNEYTFEVTVTDGDNYATREFTFVVLKRGSLTADNTWITVDSTSITADISSSMAPVWETPSNLGTYQIDNYLTIPMLVSNGNVDTVLQFETIVPRITGTISESYGVGVSTLAVSTTIAPQVGEKLTFLNTYVQSWKPSTQYRTNDILVYDNTCYQCKTAYTSGTTIGSELSIYWLIYPVTTTYTITHIVFANNIYTINISTPTEIKLSKGQLCVIGKLGSIPPGVAFDSGSNSIRGYVPYSSLRYDQFTFAISAFNFNTISGYIKTLRIFNIVMLGIDEVQIDWITKPDLGTILANHASILAVEATSANGIPLVYALVGGELPEGLELLSSGELVGSPIHC